MICICYVCSYFVEITSRVEKEEIAVLLLSHNILRYNSNVLYICLCAWYCDIFLTNLCILNRSSALCKS